MKRIPILLILVIVTSCISRNNERYILDEGTVILEAKFFKIETINGLLIYHFKNDSIEGVFSDFIDDDLPNANYKEIELNKKYALVLTKEVFNGSFIPENVEHEYTDNNVLIWKTGMKSKYFTGCKNIMGNKINPRFTMIKYINPIEP